MAESTDALTIIRELIAEEAGVEAEEVTPATTFADLDIDSLGLLTIATQAEERLGVRFDDAVITGLQSVEEMVALVTSQGDN